jgi:hypothetical protein
VLLRDYHFDNRTTFDLFNRGVGRNSGLGSILGKMHLAPKSLDSGSPGVRRHVSTSLKIVENTSRWEPKKSRNDLRNQNNTEMPIFRK